MVDALASGASIRKDVEVRVLSWAPKVFRTTKGQILSQYITGRQSLCKSDENFEGSKLV